jgi:phosphotransferase system HPr (HPr) family protein
MIERNIHVGSTMESNAAAMFVQTASQFASSIHLRLENKIINAKSIMGVISLGMLDGKDIAVIADGSDEEQAVHKLENFLGAV